MATGWEVAGETPIAPANAGGWDVKGTTPVPEPSYISRVGNALAGEGELAATAIPNVLSAAGRGILNLYHRITGNADAPAPDWLRPRYGGEAGKELADTLRSATASVPNPLGDTAHAVADAATSTLEQHAPKLAAADESILENTLGVGQDVMDIAGAAGLGGLVRNGIRSIGTAKLPPGAGNAAAEEAGLRAPDNHPIAQAFAGPSGQEALVQHNQLIGNTIAASEAGHAPDGILTPESLAQAREAPNAVYNRVAQSLPPQAGQLDNAARTGIQNAGVPEGGRVTAGSPQAQTQIDALRTQLLNPEGHSTGEQWVNELRALRQEGHKNIGSEDVSNQELGRAQLDMAKAIEGHIERNLDPNGGVSIEQFRAAREALAKNHTVESVLRGNSVDLSALARIRQAHPGLLTGGLDLLGQFAAENPDITSLATRKYEPPGFLKDVFGESGGRPASFLEPSTYVGAVGGKAAARRVLTGTSRSALERANRMFPGRPAGTFDPIPPQGAPPNPDVVPFTRPEGPPPLSASPPAGAGPRAAAPEGFSLADLLSHGVEQPPAAGLSLADELGVGGHSGQGVPFRPNLDFSAGGLEEGATPAAAPHEPLGDLAAVASQGVPEGIMARAPRRPAGTQPTIEFPGGEKTVSRAANNASGESAASQEAVNRVAEESSKGVTRYLVDPDGNTTVLRGVDAVDAKAPKGSIVIQEGGGAEPRILDRGGMTQALAKGLMNRAMARKAGKLGDALAAR